MNRARVLWGFALATVGALWLLDGAGVVRAGALVAAWWPLALVAYGLVQFADRPAHVGSAVLATAAGLGLLGLTTGAVGAAALAVAWPAALVVFGLWLLLGRRGRRAVHDDDTVAAVTMFSGRELVGRSPRFAGGSLTAICGGMQLDLRAASLDSEGARLDVSTVFGGVNVLVPPGWRVRVRGPVLFGGALDRTGPAGSRGGPLLDVRVFVIAGGVEVRSDVRRMAPS